MFKINWPLMWLCFIGGAILFIVFCEAFIHLTGN